MIDIEKLKEAQAKKLADAADCNAIEASMPVPPHSVLTFPNIGSSCPWVTYKVQTLAEAVALADKFKWEPYAYAKDSCAVIRHPAMLGQYVDKVCMEFDGAPMLQLGTVDLYIHTSRLEFYTIIAGRLLTIHIDIERHSIRIEVVKLSGSHKARTEYDVRKDYPNLHEDKRVIWASGGDTSASATYIWATEDTYRSALSDILGE